MNDNLKKYLVEPTDTIMTALKRIDINKKRFLVVVSGDIFCGTLTDGDIRRSLIRGKEGCDSICEVYTKSCIDLDVTKNLSSAIEIFMNTEFEFLPITDSGKRLINILTKRQLEIISLRNIRADLTYDFESLCEDSADYKICAKPWGFYKTTVLNDFYQSKVLCLSPHASISLQSHEHREEHWMVVSGAGEVRIGDSYISVTSGSVVFIPKNCIHRLTNISADENLMVVEVQLGEGFDESDIKRFDDEYDRTAE